MFEDRCRRILDNLEAAHAKYYTDDETPGPGLHFHVRSLDAWKRRDREAFSEYIYAALTAWGMHRLGKNGPKMAEYPEFYNSICAVWDRALELRDKTPGMLTEMDWGGLEAVFKGLHCMKSATRLVGHSKVMAHLLPNLVAPVDRNYTLLFLFGYTGITNDIDGEWQLLRQILQEFFYPIEMHEMFRAKANVWRADQARFPWDTSYLKIIDNLVIGAVGLGWHKATEGA